jgi:ribosomal-protein-alanine N-acetyltransferase
MVSTSPWQAGHFMKACSGGEVADGSRAEEYALVVDVDGEAAGFVVICVVLDEASILNIVVHPSRRRRGLALALVRAALAAIRESGGNRCLLEVRESNTAARRLYEKFGFRIDGIRRDYYPAPSGREDAVLMSVHL